MNSKELMHAAIDGRHINNFPVMVPYLMLSNADHWVEVTGQPIWKFYEWIYADPDTEQHALGYLPFFEAMPFDIFQPWYAPSREERENIRIVIKDNKPLFYDQRNDNYWAVPDKIHEAGSGGGENETRFIYDSADIKKIIKIVKAEKLVSSGVNDYLEAAMPYFNDRFIINAGVVNTFYSCVYYLGMENFYCMLHQDPELIHEMSKHLLEKNIETIRAAAMAGGDAIYIDDATATCDMISLEMYETFSLPYIIKQVDEIKRLGKKAILIYFGGISDRIEHILSAGADLLMMEASMKGYVNDFSFISNQINGRCCLAGNLNPYSDIEIKTDQQLANAIKQQIDTGRQTRKYITSTGSPLTPNTPVNRIYKMIELAHTL